MKIKGRTAAQAGKVILVSMACALFLEQATRFFLFGFASFSLRKMDSVHSFGVSGLLRRSPHPEIIYELRPNLDTVFKMARFQTNSTGLRDKEYRREKPPGTFRVAVLGDSFTMGSGLEIEETFHSILEARLNGNASAPSHEFINFAVAGYDPRQYVATLRHRALRYDPDLVFFCQSHPFEGFHADRHFREPYVVKPRTHPFFESFFLKAVAGSRLGNLFRTKQTATREDDRPGAAGDPLPVRKTREIYSQLRQIAEERAVPIWIILLQHHDREKSETTRLMRLAQRHGLPVIDTSTAFVHTRWTDVILNRLDNHPNARANELFARVIHSRLQERSFIERSR
ncbi:MAG: SGNH/GDSL hydrolase family protein [Candidatus Aminicenantes bacterium]|nr:SGNH/GDSL hydrolase family protein [Candidatus Aminicenantes bacterium]